MGKAHGAGVAMATYNGERFVAEQLTSILTQTRSPDLVVIHDDASTDETVAVLRSLADAHEVAVAVAVNATRLGVVANFTATLRAVDAQVILLCDQDDVWEPVRLARLLPMFDDPTVSAVFHNASLIAPSGTPIGRSMWGELGLTGRRADRFDRHPLRCLLRSNVAAGATMAVTRQLVDAALPVPDGMWHDEWLAIVSAATGGLRRVDDRLVRYRVHGSNVVGVPSRALFAETSRALSESGARSVDITKADVIHARLAALGASAEALREVAQRAEFMRFRAALAPFRLRRVPQVATHAVVGDYHRYTNGWRSVALDLLQHRWAENVVGGASQPTP